MPFAIIKFYRKINKQTFQGESRTNHRVHEIAYVFGGPSEKNVSPH